MESSAPADSSPGFVAVEAGVTHKKADSAYYTITLSFIPSTQFTLSALVTISQHNNHWWRVLHSCSSQDLSVNTFHSWVFFS